MNNNKIKIAAVIPFFNEAGKIDKVITKTLNYVDFVVCVDDGSNDNYMNSVFDNSKVILLKHEKNLGKGKALNTGINKAKERNPDFVICLDGDLQHDPDMIPKFISQINLGDIIIGRRDFSSKSMPFSRKLSNFFSSKILSILTGQKILDSQSGYRLINIKLFDNIVIESFGFEAETEILLKAAYNGFNMGFISIPTIYTKNDDSKIKNINSVLGFIRIIIKNLNGRIKKKTNY